MKSPVRSVWTSKKSISHSIAAQANPLGAIPMQDSEVSIFFVEGIFEANGHHAGEQRAHLQVYA